MTIRALSKVIVVVGLAHLGLALAVWWAIAPGPGGGSSSARQTGGTLAAQRLAELYAMAAFRSVITHDYAALGEVIKQATAWPEVVYVSVEDPRGKILAHTDPSMVGRVWTSALAAEVRATSREPFEEIAATMANPAAGAKSAAVGQIRLGYGLDAGGSAAVGSAAPPSSPGWALAVAAMAGIVVGLVAAMLGHGAAAETHRTEAALDDHQLHALGAELLRERTEAIQARDEIERLRAQIAQLEAGAPPQPIFAPSPTSASGRSRTISPAAS